MAARVGVFRLARCGHSGRGRTRRQGHPYRRSAPIHRVRRGRQPERQRPTLGLLLVRSLAERRARSSGIWERTSHAFKSLLAGASRPGSPRKASIRTGVGTIGGQSPSSCKADMSAAAARVRSLRRDTPPESRTNTQTASGVARWDSRLAISRARADSSGVGRPTSSSSSVR